MECLKGIRSSATCREGEGPQVEHLLYLAGKVLY